MDVMVDDPRHQEPVAGQLFDVRSFRGRPYPRDPSAPDDDGRIFQQTPRPQPRQGTSNRERVHSRTIAAHAAEFALKG
jgi:hypothetical protein